MFAAYHSFLDHELAYAMGIGDRAWIDQIGEEAGTYGFKDLSDKAADWLANH